MKVIGLSKIEFSPLLPSFKLEDSFFDNSVIIYSLNVKL